MGQCHNANHVLKYYRVHGSYLDKAQKCPFMYSARLSFSTSSSDLHAAWIEDQCIHSSTSHFCPYALDFKLTVVIHQHID
jgi:hypothetical protein